MVTKAFLPQDVKLKNQKKKSKKSKREVRENKNKFVCISAEEGATFDE